MFLVFCVLGFESVFKKLLNLLIFMLIILFFDVGKCDVLVVVIVGRVLLKFLGVVEGVNLVDVFIGIFGIFIILGFFCLMFVSGKSGKE